MKVPVQVAFYRTLYSQSAASVTAGCVAAHLAEAGHLISMTLLKKSWHDNARTLLSERPGEGTVLLAKPNFQDVGESLGILDTLRAEGAYRGLYLFGVFATLNASELMNAMPNLDGVIIGEPELAAVTLLRHISSDWKERSDGPVRGLLLRGHDGELIDGGPAAVPSLAQYRWPRRDIEKAERASLANLEASRGCIAACTFCHIPVFEATAAASKRRIRPIDDVVAEMVHLNRDLGKRYLIFNDGLFWAGHRDDARLAEFVRLLRDETAWHGEFMVYLRTNPMLSEDQLQELASVGLIRVFIGVESESKDSLKLYRKGAHADAYDVVKEALRAAGISHHIGFLTFHPFVSLEEVSSDLAFLERHDQLHRIGVILEPARLVPGTALKAQAEAAGLVRERSTGTTDHAYSYEFVDRRVSWLLGAVRLGITQALQGRHKALEYFHTSAEFLEYLVHRRIGDESLAYRPKELLNTRNELRLRLADYFAELTGIAATISTATDATSASIAAEPLHGALSRDLRALFAQTETHHALWLQAVSSSGHSDLVHGLFTGQEGL